MATAKPPNLAFSFANIPYEVLTPLNDTTTSESMASTLTTAQISNINAQSSYINIGIGAEVNMLKAVSRAQALETAQQDAINMHIPDRMKSDNNTSRRLAQIGEYYYQNQLNTLFLLQIAFLTMLLAALAAAATVAGYLNRVTGFILGGLVVAIGFALIVANLVFNNRSRDRREWHRTYFTNADGKGVGIPAPTPAQCQAHA